MPLQLSLLSSFVNDPFSRASWPKGIRKVELYAFMREQLNLLVSNPAAAGDPDLIAMRALAQCEDPASIAATLAQQCKQAGLEIIAIASFLPEIMAPSHRVIAWKDAQRALRFLVRLARELRVLGHQVFSVELVSGSAVEGIWFGRKKGPPRSVSGPAGLETRLETERFVLHKVNPIAAIHTFVERLRPVAELARGTDAEDRVYLAVELEPGPLFTIGDFASVLQLCSFLDDAGGALSDVVGLNLDIPHWAFLEGITVEDIRSQKSVLRRIVHAHVCDHSKGHFCDTVPGTHHSHEFLQWVNLLEDLPALKAAHSLPYSGCLSLELEACGLAAAEEAIKEARKWGVLV